jgi:DNA-binding MarR family transcriptional regulator
VTGPPVQPLHSLTGRVEPPGLQKDRTFIETARRAQIMAAAIDTIAELGYGQASLARIARARADRRGAHGLSIVQTRLLGILRDRRPTIKELARFLQLDKSSVTGLVDRAQERGLVRRTASTLDPRSVQVTITAAGQELVDRVTAAFGAEIAVLVADLNPTRRARLSATASLIAVADARLRGTDILNVEPAPTDKSMIGNGH